MQALLFPNSFFFIPPINTVFYLIERLIQLVFYLIEPIVDKEQKREKGEPHACVCRGYIFYSGYFSGKN